MGGGLEAEALHGIYPRGNTVGSVHRENREERRMDHMIYGQGSDLSLNLSFRQDPGASAQQIQHLDTDPGSCSYSPVPSCLRNGIDKFQGPALNNRHIHCQCHGASNVKGGRVRNGRSENRLESKTESRFSCSGCARSSKHPGHTVKCVSHVSWSHRARPRI